MSTWIKLYTETLSDPKMGRMSDHLYRRTVELFMLAGTIDQDGLLPDIEDIAWTLHTSPKDIRETVDALSGLGVLTVSGQQIIVTHFAERQQSNLTEAERKAAYRDKQRTKFGQMSGQVSGQTADKCPDNSPTDVQKMSRPDTDTDIDTETDKDINSFSNEKEYTRAKKDPKDRKSRYGTFDNVWLTNDEYLKLQQRFPDWADRLEAFGTAKKAKGYVYKSDYAAILNWARMDEEKAKAAPVPKTTVDYLEGVTWEGMDDE